MIISSLVFVWTSPYSSIDRGWEWSTKASCYPIGHAQGTAHISRN